MLERLGVAATQFVLQIVLARLLSPNDYGMLAIMIVFVNLATVFVQSGLNTALIQRQDIEEEDYSSVFVLSLGIAILLYGLIFVSAPWIADFYSMPDLVAPLRVLALMLIPGAVNSVQIAKVSKDMDFKKIFFSNVGGIVTSGAIGILIACVGGGVWALVAQTLINSVVVCIIMRSTVQLKLRLSCNFDRIKVLFSYGWKLLTSSLIDTLYQDLESLVVGKKYDSGTLGYYNKGREIPQMINRIVNMTVQSVMLPAMSAEQDNKKQMKKMTSFSIQLLGYVMFPIMAGLAAVAPAAVEFLFTEKWLPCVIYMQISCFTFALYPIQSSNLQAIMAMGRSDIFLKLEIIKKSYGIVFLLIAVFCFESPVAIAAMGLITTVISWFVNSYPNRKLINYSIKEQFIDLLPSMLMAVTMSVIVTMIGKLELNVFVILCIQIIVGVAVYLLLSMIFKPEAYRILLEQVKNLKRKR